MNSFYADVKKGDYDRFICALFSDMQDRDDLITLYAFNLEIAKIREVTSEPLTAMIRMKWWNEAIEEIYAGKNPRKHEVVEALSAVIKRKNLPKELLLEILYGREKDINNEQPQTIGELLSYAKETSGKLALLALQILGINNSDAKAAAEHLGTAWALQGVLRSCYIHMPRNIFYFPEDIMKENKISRDNFGSEKFLRGSKQVVKQITEEAESHLQMSKMIIKNLDKETRKKGAPVFLLSRLAEKYLKKIRKNDFDVLTRRTEIMPIAKFLLFV